MLQRIKPQSVEPWLMIGDFNEAMWKEEHLPLSRRSERLMKDFRYLLSHCDLHDIGFMGQAWTFDNKRKGDSNVRVRLDRAAATPAWSLCFPEYRLRHLSSSRSDHRPLLVAAVQATNCRLERLIRRYEIAWEREPFLAATVEEAWSRRVPSHDLGEVNAALKDVMTSLYGWKAKNFKPVAKELESM
jgi:hypothetical protein